MTERVRELDRGERRRRGSGECTIVIRDHKTKPRWGRFKTRTKDFTRTKVVEEENKKWKLTPDLENGCNRK